MPDRRIVVAQYCDDIRQEVANKISLIGCYGADMLVGKFPAVMPKFCALVRVMAPIAEPLSRFIVRLTRDGQPLAEMPVEISSSSNGLISPADARVQVISVAIVISPCTLEGPCVVRAEIDEAGEITAGTAIRVSLADAGHGSVREGSLID